MHWRVEQNLLITSVLNPIFLVIWPNVTSPLVGVEGMCISVSGPLYLILANVLWQKKNKNNNKTKKHTKNFVLAPDGLLVDKQ